MKPLLPLFALGALLASAACNDKGSAPPAAAALAAPGTPSPTADNTRMNARDDGGTPTPMDQGNDEKDIKITQAIRKAIMADDSLSSNAKNCKVITMGGKVTLRGPVASASERSNIDTKAHATPDVVSVDDQLEVKTN